MKEREMMVESNKQANKQMDKQAKAPSLNFVEGEKMWASAKEKKLIRKVLFFSPRKSIISLNKSSHETWTFRLASKFVFKLDTKNCGKFCQHVK